MCSWSNPGHISKFHDQEDLKAESIPSEKIGAHCHLTFSQVFQET